MYCPLWIIHLIHRVKKYYLKHAEMKSTPNVLGLLWLNQDPTNASVVATHQERYDSGKSRGMNTLIKNVDRFRVGQFSFFRMKN
jgi:predicted DCC family thiol-disulfide oxidoreductase YuxK